MKRYLIGIDFGTHETKGCCVTVDGVVVAKASRAHTLITPKPGYAEHDPEKQWWVEFVGIVQELMGQAGIKPEEIGAIGISTVMAAVVFLDDYARPLRNAILYGIDTRSVPQAKKINKIIGKEKLEKDFGGVCTAESFGPKILWVKENEPQIFAKTKHITFESGYLNARLTGVYAVSRYTVQGAKPMVDKQSQHWIPEYCNMFCPIELLPSIVEASDVIGTVTAEAARETGLAEGTPVIAGCTDAGAEALSSGVISSGDTMLMYGSTAFVLHVTEKKEATKGLWHTPYLIQGEYASCGGMGTTGAITTWIKDNMAKELVQLQKEGGKNAYDTLFDEASHVPLGSEGVMVLPYFMGRRMPEPDPLASGMIFGLKMYHTRSTIMHAVFEGIGYGISQILELLGDLDSYKDNIRAIGGGTKTPLWLQIVSDICGVTQTVPKVKIGAAYGDALLAGLGVGLITSKQEIASMIQPDFVIYPDPHRWKQYVPYRECFRKLYDNNREMMHTMNLLSKKSEK
jgi:xylulokinase